MSGRVLFGLLFTLCMCLPFTAAADQESSTGSGRGLDDSDKNNDTGEEDYVFALLMNPVDVVWQLVLKDIPLIPQFQLRITRHLALDVIPFYINSYNHDATYVERWSAGGALGLRISPLGTGLEGFYLVPRIHVQYWKMVTDGNCQFNLGGLGFVPGTWCIYVCTFCEGCRVREHDLWFTGITIEAGYSWIWDHFVMNLGMAAGWGYNFHHDENTYLLQFNTSLGFAI